MGGFLSDFYNDDRKEIDVMWCICVSSSRVDCVDDECVLYSVLYLYVS